MDERFELIQMLDQAHEKMRLVTNLAQRNVKIYPLWTMKEVIAHLTGWDAVTVESLRIHARGEIPLTPARRGINHYNAQTVAERENLDFNDIIHEWEETRNELKRTLQELPEDRYLEKIVYPWGPTGSVKKMISIFIEHEKEHAEEILEILKS